MTRSLRSLLFRRVSFQVHLWLGIVLSAYVVVIALSGSMLVFEEELRSVQLRDLHYDAAHTALPSTVIASAAAAIPATKVTYLLWPRPGKPAFTVYLRNARKEKRTILADAVTGQPMPARRLFVDWLHDLHVYLLMGETGYRINCVAGIGLLVMTATGVVIWWRGLRTWKRGFVVSLRHRWRRINYDAHSAIGIWTMLIVSWWGITAINFLWPKQVAHVVSVVSPLRAMLPPALPKAAHPGATASVDTLAARALQLCPGCHLYGMGLPATPGGNTTVTATVRAPEDFTHREIYTFAPDGTLLTTWHYGQNITAGDWFLWLMDPLHFGSQWGLAVKALWCALGLLLAVLPVTGLIMYWNRALGGRWRALRNGTA